MASLQANVADGRSLSCLPEAIVWLAVGTGADQNCVRTLGAVDGCAEASLGAVLMAGAEGDGAAPTELRIVAQAGIDVVIDVMISHLQQSARGILLAGSQPIAVNIDCGGGQLRLTGTATGGL